MIWLNATLRLANDPRPITTKTGTAMASAFGFADIDGEDDLGLALLAFGPIAEELLRYRKGGTIRVTGTLKENRYTAKGDGSEVVQLQIVADGLAGVKRGNPVQDERRPKQRKAQERQGGAPFDDRIEF